MPKVKPEDIVKELTSTNDQVLLDVLKHAVYIERLKATQSKALLAFIDTKLVPDLIRRLTGRLQLIADRGSDLGPVTTKRVKELLATMYEILQTNMEKVSAQVQSDLYNLLKYEAKWQTSSLSKAIGSVGVDFVSPDLRSLSIIISGKPFRGKIVKKWFTDLAKTTRNAVQEQMGISIAQGESFVQMSKRIIGTKSLGYSDGVMGGLKRHVDSNLRTVTSYAANQARQEVYKTNSDLLSGEKFVATLDSKTTPICQSLDGKVFPVGEGPIPPLHYNCRSLRIPLVKSWKQLGINLKEAPEGTRASVDGQVPASMTYGEWLKMQPASVQDDILGPTRAELFREGEVSISAFVGSDGRLLNLDDLAKREGITI